MKKFDLTLCNCPYHCFRWSISDQLEETG